MMITPLLEAQGLHLLNLHWGHHHLRGVTSICSPLCLTRILENAREAIDRCDKSFFLHLSAVGPKVLRNWDRFLSPRYHGNLPFIKGKPFASLPGGNLARRRRLKVDSVVEEHPASGSRVSNST